MRIKDVVAYPLFAPQTGPISGFLPYATTLSQLVRKGNASCLVGIIADNGTTGIGESLVREVPEATAAIVERLLKPALLGSDPFDIAVLWETMFATLRTRGHSKGYLLEAISGVDCALWDLMRKALDLPAYKLLGV